MSSTRPCPCCGGKLHLIGENGLRDPRSCTGATSGSSVSAGRVITAGAWGPSITPRPRAADRQGLTNPAQLVTFRSTGNQR